MSARLQVVFIYHIEEHVRDAVHRLVGYEGDYVGVASIRVYVSFLDMFDEYVDAVNLQPQYYTNAVKELVALRNRVDDDDSRESLDAVLTDMASSPTPTFVQFDFW